MQRNNDFLIKYNQDLRKNVDSLHGFTSFKKFINDKDYKSHIAYDFKETYDYLEAVRHVLDKVIAIVYKPYNKAMTEEIIIRSELASHLTTEGYKETLKDSKLWKNKNGVMSPEYVHNEIYIDSMRTYENRFICFLVDLINEDVEEIIANIKPLTNCIEQEFEVKGMTYGKHSILNELTSDGKPLKRSFSYKTGDKDYVLELAHRLYKRIKNIEASEFYRVNKRDEFNHNIEPTNILIHDNVYSFCYKFYLDHYLNPIHNYRYQRDINYYNYVLCILLTHFKDQIDEKMPLYYQNDKLRFNAIKINNGMFKYIIKDNKDDLSLEIMSSLDDGDALSQPAKYYVLVSYKYDEKNEKVINEKLDNKRGEYDEVILAVQSNLINEFYNVANISIYNEDNDLFIKNIFASLSLIFEIDENDYDVNCPICGDKHPIIVNDNYVCNKCHGKYQIIQKPEVNKKYLWIKSLRRE